MKIKAGDIKMVCCESDKLQSFWLNGTVTNHRISVLILRVDGDYCDVITLDGDHPPTGSSLLNNVCLKYNLDQAKFAKSFFIASVHRRALFDKRPCRAC